MRRYVILGVGLAAVAARLLFGQGFGSYSHDGPFFSPSNDPNPPHFGDLVMWWDNADLATNTAMTSGLWVDRIRGWTFSQTNGIMTNHAYGVQFLDYGTFTNASPTPGSRLIASNFWLSGGSIPLSTSNYTVYVSGILERRSSTDIISHNNSSGFHITENFSTNLWGINHAVSPVAYLSFMPPLYKRFSMFVHYDESSNMISCVNGSVMVTNVLRPRQTDNTSFTELGCVGTSGSPLAGSIAEVMIWKNVSAWTLDEIQSLHARSLRNKPYHREWTLVTEPSIGGTITEKFEARYQAFGATPYWTNQANSAEQPKGWPGSDSAATNALWLDTHTPFNTVYGVRYFDSASGFHTNASIAFAANNTLLWTLRKHSVTTPATEYVLYKGSGQSILYSSGRVRIGTINISPVIANRGAPHTIGITIDSSGNISSFVNGAYYTNMLSTTLIGTYTNLAGSMAATGNSLQGELGDLRIYNFVLGTNQIQSYNDWATNQYDGLHWTHVYSE